MPNPRSRLHSPTTAVAALGATAALLLAAGPAQASSDALKSPTKFKNAIQNDNTLAAETLPHGAPTWSKAPRQNYGNNPHGFKGFVPWGQLYTCASGNPQPKARVQLAGLRGYIMSKKTHKWTAVPSADPVNGALYAEDFSSNTTTPADTIRIGASVAARVPVGKTYHFVTSSFRQPIDPTDVNGVLVLMAARLAPGTFSTTGAAPCLTLDVGADYWRTVDAVYDGQVNNDDVGMSRFKRVQTGWRLYAMSSNSKATLTTYPVPNPYPQGLRTDLGRFTCGPLVKTYDFIDPCDSLPS